MYLGHLMRRSAAAVASAVVVAAAMSAAPTAAAAGTGTFSGTVRGVDGRVLQNVTVQAVVTRSPVFGNQVLAQTLTRANGTYRLAVPVSDDPVTLQFVPDGAIGGGSATGYADRCYRGLDVCEDGQGPRYAVTAGGARTGFDITLLRAAIVAGRVTDARGNSVANFPVILWRADNDPCLNAGDVFVPLQYGLTDPNGNYRFTRLPSTPAVLCVGSLYYDPHTGAPNPDGYGPGRLPTFTPAGGSVTTKNVTADARGGVSGRVVDSTGAPVADASVSIVDDADVRSVSPVALTDANGAFRVFGVDAGRWRYCVFSAADATCAGDPGSFPPVTVKPFTVSRVGTLVVPRQS